jgi:hypothetical protein
VDLVFKPALLFESNYKKVVNLDSILDGIIPAFQILPYRSKHDFQCRLDRKILSIPSGKNG